MHCKPSIQYVLLVDGDNINPSYLMPLSDFISSNFGAVAAVHVFGKLNSPYLVDWRQTFEEGANNLITYNVSSCKKNSTDVEMVQVAWRLFYRDNVKGFVIVSCDSDMEVIVKNLNQEASVMVAYCKDRTGTKYLESLRSDRISCLDLDKIRGQLEEAEVSKIINISTQSYLESALNTRTFSYKALTDWIVGRYPELVNKLTPDTLRRFLSDKTVRFTEDGVRVC